MLTAEMIRDAIRQANSEQHDSLDGWLDFDDLEDSVIDSHVNLVRVAELLSAAVAEKKQGNARSPRTD